MLLKRGTTLIASPRTAVDLAESPRPWADLVGIGTPRGGMVQVGALPPPPPPQLRIHPSPLCPVRTTADRDAPWGDSAARCRPSPTHTAADTPESPLSWADCVGIGTPYGGMVWVDAPPPPHTHNGGCTRVPSVVGSPCGDRDALWGDGVGWGDGAGGPPPQHTHTHTHTHSEWQCWISSQ